MKATDLAQLGVRIRECVESAKPAQALALAEPVLRDGALPARQIEVLGLMLAEAPADELRDFLDRVARANTRGGWRLLAAALVPFVDRSPYWTLETARHFIRQAGTPGTADTLATRIITPALERYPDASLAVLHEWRDARSPLVRRALGVAVRGWAETTEGHGNTAGQAQVVLNLLASAATEKDRIAAHGLRTGLEAVRARWPAAVRRWERQQAKQRPRAGGE